LDQYYTTVFSSKRYNKGIKQISSLKRTRRDHFLDRDKLPYIVVTQKDLVLRGTGNSQKVVSMNNVVPN